MKTEIHIFDLDGCIIDSAHRYKTLNNQGQQIDLDYWIDNSTPEKIWHDSLLPLAAYYKAQLINPLSFVIIATSRQCTKPDFEYIIEHLGEPDKFIYRKQGETTKGYILKCNPILPLLNLKQFKDCFVHVWEDNKIQLAIMAKKLNAIPHYIPSNQGH